MKTPIFEDNKKVLFLNDTTEWYHFGCTATSTAIKEEVVKLGYNLTSVPITETYKFSSFPTSYTEFTKLSNFEEFSKANRKIIELIQSHDIVLMNGEGTLHGVRPAPTSLLYIAYVAKTFLKKHVEIINHSAYPQDNLSLDNLDVINLYKLVYQAIDFSAIREPVSLSLMQQLSIKCTESFDCMPLYIQNHYKPHRIKDNNTLLIAGSAAWLHLNILSNDRGNIEEFEQGLSQFIAYIDEMAKRGYKIEFLYGAQGFPSKDDREFIAFVEPRLSCKWSVVTAKSLDEWLGFIEKAALLVSGRFHHSIAAACLGTPFIALNSNTPKIEGLLRSLDHTNVINYEDNNLLIKLLNISEEIRQQSKPEVRLEELCNKAMQNFVSLKELMLLLTNKENQQTEKNNFWESFINKASSALQPYEKGKSL